MHTKLFNTPAWEPFDFTQEVNPKTIQFRHTLTLSHETDWVMLINDHYVLVGGGIEPLIVSCVNILDGSILWQQNFHSDVFSRPLFHNNVVYVGLQESNGKNNSAAIDFNTGEKLWETYIANSSNTFSNGSERVIDKDTLYFFSGAGRLFAYDINTGKTRFQEKVDKSDPWVTPILWNDKVLIQTTISDKSSLMYIDSVTGKQLKTVSLVKGINVGRKNTGSPILLDNELWYIAIDNKLHCFDLAQEKEKASYDLPLKITEKDQYEYINASMKYEDGKFCIRAEVSVFTAAECDVTFDIATGVFTTNAAAPEDKCFITECGAYRYYQDYNLRPQFEYYITDKNTGGILTSFPLPDNGEYEMPGKFKVLKNGTVIIYLPDYDKEICQLLIAY